MNDAWGESNEEITEPTGNGLRQFAESMQKQNKELLARLDAMENERKQERLQSVFVEMGVPDAAKLYQGEPDPEKAKEWAESMRSVFGTGNAQAPSPEVVPPAPAISPEAVNQYQQIVEAGATAQPLTTIEAGIAAQRSATSIEELAANLENFMKGS